jgi:hypothetical protein
VFVIYWAKVIGRLLLGKDRLFYHYRKIKRLIVSGYGWWGYQLVFIERRKTPCRLSDFYNLNLEKWGDI